MPEEMKLIDKYLPEYTHNECHETIVNASMETVYEAAKDFDMSKSRLIRWLFKIRGLPSYRMNLQDFVDDIGFTKLEEDFPRENLIGFWMRRKMAPVTGFEDFVNNSISAWVKVVWNFYLEETGNNSVRLSTETRVLCIAPFTRITFGLYWFFIKPFSGIIRLKMLQLIKKDAETADKTDVLVTKTDQ